MNNDEPNIESYTPGELSEEQRLFNEINLLRIEGYYFCLDPKAAGRRKSTQEFFERLKTPKEILERPITIEPHPTHGYPSVLAYKVLQAIVKKLSDYGYPVPGAVSFSQRELARLSGRKSYGGWNQEQFYRAIKQLQHTEITCWFYHKDEDTWAAVSFDILDSALFSGKRNQITQCCVQLHPVIVRSLNNRHTFCLNYSRMEALEPIATALFKRLFFHFSNLYSQKRDTTFSFTKDYASICASWLGGIKPERYKSRITSNQLGRHLAAIKRTKLIRSWDIHKNAQSDGFNVSFTPGPAFFEDYTRFYSNNSQLEMQFQKAADERKLQQPMEIVGYFYKRLYQTEELEEAIFSDRDTAFAASLLEKYSLEDIHDWIDFSLRKARETHFDIKNLGGIKVYRTEFAFERKREKSRKALERKEREQQRERKLLDEYTVFRKDELEKIRGRLAPEELHDIEDSARKSLEKDNPYPIGRDFFVRAQTDRTLAERYSLPSFDEWKSRCGF